jgi:uncharacterized protein YjbI with pentapeptide repeats
MVFWIAGISVVVILLISAAAMDVFWWVGIGIATFILVPLLWWRFPKWQMKSITAGEPKARADIEDNFRKTVGQAVGGIIVLIGAGVAYYGTQQTLRQNEELTRDNQGASYNQLIDQQVAKGFELLGSDKKVVRAGGIYLLEVAMRKSDQYYMPLLEALCAIIRDTSQTNLNGYTPTDIQAAFTVIGRRRVYTRFPWQGPWEDNPGWFGVDLSGAHIPGAHQEVFANLQHAFLMNADLTGADLPGANLFYADLSGANLSGADLSGANLTGADLSRANLSGAELAGARMMGTVLSGANLAQAHFTSPPRVKKHRPGVGNKSYPLSDAQLTDVSLGSAADLTGIIISQAQLDHLCGDAALLARLPAGLTLKPCLPP